MTGVNSRTRMLINSLEVTFFLFRSSMDGFSFLQSERISGSSGGGEEGTVSTSAGERGAEAGGEGEEGEITVSS